MQKRIRKSHFKDGDYITKYFSQLSSSKLLSPKEERELFRRNEEYIISIFCELMSLPEAGESLKGYYQR